MKKYFVLLMILVLVISFSVSCMNKAENFQQKLSVVGSPVHVGLFEPKGVFVTVKDSEQITPSMGRVIVEWQLGSGKVLPNDLFSVLIIPYRNIPKGTYLKLKRVTYVADSDGFQEKILMVE